MFPSSMYYDVARSVASRTLLRLWRLLKLFTMTILAANRIHLIVRIKMAIIGMSTFAGPSVTKILVVNRPRVFINENATTHSSY
jgi:hypothetical protein